MGIPGLTIIAESINDSVPSTHKMFEAGDMNGILELAKFQAEKGAGYIDVNVGLRSPELMAEVVTAIQKEISLPLSIDSPDYKIVEAGLKAYDAGRAGGKLPILNSISEARLEMFDLYALQRFIPIMLVTESMDALGSMLMNKTTDQTFETVKHMVSIARERVPEIKNDHLILDPGIIPIGSDMDGQFKRLLTTIQRIHEDADLAGIHMSVGLSNFTTMLPSKTSDGLSVKSSLESAFLTMAMPMGFDTIIGSVRRKYAILEDEHPAMQCLKDFLTMEGPNAVMRVMQFYS